MRWLIGLLGLWWAGACNAESSQDIESALLFNTVCAQCHEGECAGRLSFSSGEAAAVTHTRRYAGEVSDETVSELFGLLTDMKQRCVLAPMPVAVPPNGVWSAAELASLRDPTQRWYFVPLGTLTVGDYRLGLSLNQSASLAVEVISSDFERLVDEPHCMNDGTLRLGLSVSEPMPYYLRIKVAPAVVLTRVELGR